MGQKDFRQWMGNGGERWPAPEVNLYIQCDPNKNTELVLEID